MDLIQLLDWTGAEIGHWHGDAMPLFTQPNQNYNAPYTLVINGHEFKVPPGPLNTEIYYILEANKEKRNPK
jgi:hypothetical protein